MGLGATPPFYLYFRFVISTLLLSREKNKLQVLSNTADYIYNYIATHLYPSERGHKGE